MMKFFYLVMISYVLSEVNANAQIGDCGGSGSGSIDVNYSYDTNKVYTYIGQWPKFQGWDANSEFSKRDIRYSDFSKVTEEEKKTSTIVAFTVEKDGSLTDIKILKSALPSYDEDARKVVSNMPKWLPGKNNGVPVRCRYKVFIIYHPSQE